jgi:multisubunit Na+/H+ antiporter MnhG subunit
MTVLAAILTGVGVLICAASAIGAVTRRDPLDRLHYLSPITSAGTPLIGIGLAIHAGRHLATAMLLLCVVVVFLAGPVLASATGHVLHLERQPEDS